MNKFNILLAVMFILVLTGLFMWAVRLEAYYNTDADRHRIIFEDNKATWHYEWDN